MRSEGAELNLSKIPENKGDPDYFRTLPEIGRFWCGKGAEIRKAQNGRKGRSFGHTGQEEENSIPHLFVLARVVHSGRRTGAAFEKR
jgi:hypothetical protein